MNNAAIPDVTHIAIYMTYGQCVELHEWLDEFHPGWIYCGSQFFVRKEVTRLMTFDELHTMYRRQRVGHASFYSNHRVTNHFYIPDLSDADLIRMRLCWDVRYYEVV